MQIYLNGTLIVDQLFNTGVHRAGQEIVEANVLKAENNSMHVLAVGPQIVLSDFVMFYQANI